MNQRPNWYGIYNYFITHENITLRDCANEFAVSYLSLRQKASDEKWTEKKRQLYTAVLDDLKLRTIEEIKARTLEQVKQAQLLQQEGVAAIHKFGARPKTFEEARKAIEIGQEMERKILGMDKGKTSRSRI